MGPGRWIAALGLACLLPALDAAAQAELTYGPVLTRRPPGMEAAGPPPAAMPAPAAAPSATDAAQPAPARRRAVPYRHPSLQGSGPMAPRPLQGADSARVFVPVPVPPPAVPPEPVVPTSTLNGTCQGGLCRDAAGNTMNRGAGGAGVSSDGRLCVRGPVTVQCF